MAIPAQGIIMSDRWTVLLVRPENPEKIGLAARAMKNTGFDRLRLVGLDGLEDRSFVTAVHAGDILSRAEFFLNPGDATRDLDVVFAATAKARKNFSRLSLQEAVEEMERFPPKVKIGIIFGNERTGLTSQDLEVSNFRFTLPQAQPQPSYNLAAAVLLTLFRIYTSEPGPPAALRPEPLTRLEQDECMRLILGRLENRGFIHQTNRKHMTEQVKNLFGRLTLTDKDRSLLLALFNKGVK